MGYCEYLPSNSKGPCTRQLKLQKNAVDIVAYVEKSFSCSVRGVLHLLDAIYMITLHNGLTA